MSKTNKRRMPSKMTIIRYWLNHHDKHPEAKRWMDRVGEYFVERTHKDEHDICFACDFINETTEKAHIKARCNGGNDEPDNLHLLCPQCHKASEFMEGQAYWNWIADRRWWHLGIRNMVIKGYLTEKEASLVLLYYDGDADMRRMLADRIGELPESVTRNIESVRAVQRTNRAYHERVGD